MPKTLLLADDSITIQKVVGIIFASEDYSVTTVDNGEDALSRLRELRPAVVLADAVMPRKNGYELCEAVKNDPELRGTPVLLLAGTFEAFDEARARAVGADGWIQKPFESAALVGKVREIVEGIAPPAPAAQPWTTAAAPAAATPAIAPPPPGAPLPPGARPLPTAAPSPFAVPSQPAPPRPPAPPPSPFATRPAVPPTPPPPPFAARPQPPAPPPPPPAPAFSAPRPQQQPSAAAPSFSAPQAPVVVPFPPPPRAAEAAPPAPPPEPVEAASDPFADLDAEPMPASVELAPPPAPPAAPAIPTQKVSPTVEPDAELDFDIDEAAAPIDLEDLAAEEISDDESLLAETRAEVEPLPAMDLFAEEARTPPPFDLGRGEDTLEPLEDIEALELEPEPTLELQPEPERGPEPEPQAEIEAEPHAETEEPKPFELPSFEPFQLDAMPEPAEPAREILAAATAAGPADELAPPPIAVAADEAVLREVLSRASRETIERVVWEVVPQLAETIIREHLEQLMRDRKIIS